MASSIRVRTTGGSELRRDLEALSIGLGRELTRTVKDAVGLVLPPARVLAPYDPEHAANRKDGLPHIRDSMYALALGNSAAIAARHPGTIVHQWGGTIAPRGHAITIKRSGLARDAAKAQLPAINALLERRIDALVHKYFPR